MPFTNYKTIEADILGKVNDTDMMLLGFNNARYIADNTYLSYCNNEELSNMECYMNAHEYLPELKKPVITVKRNVFRIQEMHIFIVPIKNVLCSEYDRAEIPVCERLSFTLLPEKLSLSSIDYWMPIPNAPEKEKTDETI